MCLLGPPLSARCHQRTPRLTFCRRLLTNPSPQGPLPLMAEMYKKHGEVFTIPLLHKRMTFLVGPHVSPHFFNATDDKMSQTEASTGRAGRAFPQSTCWLQRLDQPLWEEGDRHGCMA